MRECFGQFSMFGNGRNDRHEVGFSGAVVAYDKEPFIVGRLFKLQLWEDHGYEPLSHFRRNGVCCHKLVGLTPFIGITEPNDRLNGIKLDKIAVLHHVGPLLPALSAANQEPISGHTITRSSSAYRRYSG